MKYTPWVSTPPPTSVAPPRPQLLDRPTLRTRVLPPSRDPRAENYSMWIRRALLGVLAYHGWKRNRSVPWALAWAVAGTVFGPGCFMAVAVGQGFAQPKGKS